MIYLKNEYDERDAGWLFTIFIAALLIGSTVINLIIQQAASFGGTVYDEFIKKPAVMWTMQGVLYLILLITVFIYHRRTKTNFVKANGFDKKINLFDIFMSVISGAGMLFTFLIFTFIFSYLLQQAGYKNSASSFEINSAVTFITAIIILCLLPAIVEETVFRGAALRGYFKIFGTIKAVILSAFFFMLMHMNISQFVNAFLCGVLLAVFTHITKDIKVSMIMHFVNNFIIVLMTYIESFNTEPQADDLVVFNIETLTPYLIMFSIGIVLLVLGFIYFFKKRSKLDIETEPEEKPQPVFESIAAIPVKQERYAKLKILTCAAIGVGAALLMTVLNIFYA